MSQRAREVAQRLGRPDLELVALDSISAVLNIRGHYGYAEPIDRERVEITRLVREPFEISDTYYTAGWSALEVGNYRVVVALAAEFEALNVDLPPLGQLANSVIARLPLGDWDEALAEQTRLRELFGAESTGPPELRERRPRSRGAHPRAPRRGGRRRCRPRRDRRLGDRRRATPAVGQPSGSGHRGAARRLRTRPRLSRAARGEARHLSRARARGALHADRRGGRLERGRRAPRAGARARRGRPAARARRARRPPRGPRAPSPPAMPRPRASPSSAPSRVSTSWAPRGSVRSPSSRSARRSRHSAATPMRPSACRVPLPCSSGFACRASSARARELISRLPASPA